MREINLDNASLPQLAEHAQRAFSLGYTHAADAQRILTGSAVMSALFRDGWGGRKLHRTKLRQVYGAGYDLGAMARRIAVS